MVALVAVLAVGIVLVGRDEAPPPKPVLPLDVWAPYWALDDSLTELDRRAGSMREISPFWFNSVGATEIVVDPNTPLDAAEEFLRIAERSGAAVVPSLVDAMPAGGMAAVLADPLTRTSHVETIVAFARDGDFDGIDLDYEQFAFADGRATWADTRPNWVAFVEELSAALRADGRSLTVSIPPVYDDDRGPDSGFWVYDHGAIAPHVDRIRIMAYDFSVAEPGPIAPLDWVEQAVAGTIEATGEPGKLVLGLPAYGRNWATFVAGDCPDDAPGTTTITLRNVDELLQRRDVSATFVEETGESVVEYDLEVDDGARSCTQTRQMHFVDARGIRLRFDLARREQLGGVSLWAFGFEDAETWDQILAVVE